MGRWVGQTMTILDNNTMNSVQFEDHVIAEFRWGGTVFARRMAKLDDLAEGGESRRFEEQTSPSLGLMVSNKHEKPKGTRTSIEWSGWVSWIARMHPLHITSLLKHSLQR